MLRKKKKGNSFINEDTEKTDKHFLPTWGYEPISNKENNVTQDCEKEATPLNYLALKPESTSYVPFENEQCLASGEAHLASGSEIGMSGTNLGMFNIYST